MNGIQEAKKRQEKCTYIAGQTQGVLDLLQKIRHNGQDGHAPEDVEKSAQFILDELEAKYQKALRGI